MEKNINELSFTETDPTRSGLQTIVKAPGDSESSKMNLNLLFQTLNFNGAKKKLSISNGNEVDLGTYFLPDGYISGFSIANTWLDNGYIDINVGNCIDSTNTESIENNTIIRKIVSFSFGEGNNSGCLDNTYSDGIWYLFAISKLNGSDADYLLSKSPIAPTLPTDYLYFRLIGSLLLSGSTIKSYTNYYELELNYTKFQNYHYCNFGLSLPLEYISSTYNIAKTVLISNPLLKAINVSNLKTVANLSINGVNIFIPSLSKSENLFTEGAGGGAFITTVTNNTNYNIYAIGGEGKNLDICIALPSFNSSNYPAGYEYARLIGYLFVNSIGEWQVLNINSLENSNIFISDTHTLKTYYKNVTFNGTANATFNLPTLSSSIGMKTNIFNSSTYDIELNGNASETIQGDLTKTIPANSNVTIFNNSIEWKLL